MDQGRLVYGTTVGCPPDGDSRRTVLMDLVEKIEAYLPPRDIDESAALHELRAAVRAARKSEERASQ